MLRTGGKSTSVVSGGRKKVHTTFDDGSEMVEEYDAKTNELLVRKRRTRTVLGKENDWEYIVGDAPQTFNPDSTLMKESTQNPCFSRKDSKVNFEWRVRNLPYPPSTYDVSIDHNDGKIVIRTSNKKYYKRIDVPEMKVLGAPLEDSCLQWKHANNTLIVSYRKPEEALKADQEDQKFIKQAKTSTGGADMDLDNPEGCKQQ
ncbi:hypothetical protein CYMTET_21250 [Cymbomonas tetramitiformis]|uniref:Protein DPCD n=1 Tax=Cymbomonas tetramitiformis TaxID=36881 RepID=A0AAE0G2A9_9CHLO|nr:hypothetical protein CYMTET_21250 [Cymbomonas tetramitiformis]